MSKLDEDLIEKLDEAINQGFTDNVKDNIKRKVNDLLSDIESELDYMLVDRLKEYLSGHVLDMAAKAVISILEGDEERLRDYLSCNPYNYTGRDKDHPVIHGTLFEQGALKLRKNIVDAYPELLKNERILDLESQVTSLVIQVNKEKARAEEYYERYVR